MIATQTHRVTIPRKISTILSKRAEADNVSFSQAFCAVFEEHMEMLEDLRLSRILAEREAAGERLIQLSNAAEYAEEGHIWEEALERENTCTGELIPDDEFWKLANEIPYIP